ncbi:MAG: hypothetical protein QOD73_1717, partial [Solirubrobacteraceae bacterium]|nr:hypothetical protein [Solirubrobacteraceae bacterium]
PADAALPVDAEAGDPMEPDAAEPIDREGVEPTERESVGPANPRAAQGDDEAVEPVRPAPGGNHQHGQEQLELKPERSDPSER